jgi:uncharacterized membrane protein YkoI
MNAKILVVAAICAALGAPLPAQQPQRVTTDGLPTAVQRALAEASKGEPIKTINRRVIDGRTIYDIELERDNAINPRFRITEEGIVIAGTPRDSSDTTMAYDGVGIPEAPFDPMIPIETLPAAVRETIKHEAAGRPIADIDRETWQGRTVYEVEFKASGRNPQIHVAEDGTIVRAEQPRGSELGTSIRSLFMGTQLEDTPPVVQETIRREARDRAIRDIDLERRSGQRIFEVEIDDGRNGFQIHVAEDGRILHDTRPGVSPPKRG